MACTCRGFRAAHAESWWPAFDPATGNVLEPRSRRFWRELSPGDNLRAAVKKCPKGGCILLRPGIYALAPHKSSYNAGLAIEAPVSLFGRGLATLQSPGCSPLLDVSGATFPFALDGLVVQTLGGNRTGDSVLVFGGPVRLQACTIAGPCGTAIRIVGRAENDPSRSPVIINCKCVGAEKTNGQE